MGDCSWSFPTIELKLLSSWLGIGSGYCMSKHATISSVGTGQSVLHL